KSDIHRATFLLEYEQFKSSTAWIERTFTIGQRAYPLLLVLAPLGGFLFLRRRHRAPQRARPRTMKLLLAWDLFRKLWPLVRFLYSRKSSRPEETVAP